MTADLINHISGLKSFFFKPFALVLYQGRKDFESEAAELEARGERGLAFEEPPPILL